MTNKTQIIERLKINNFKAHLDTDLETSYLNLITGKNGIGKSSILQVLLLLRQSYEKGSLSEAAIDLNRPLCNIGSINDALYRGSETSPIISFAIETSKYKGKKRLGWSSEAIDKENQEGLKLTYLPLEKNEKRSLKELGLFNENFQYLSAARLAPQEYYLRDDYELKKRQISIQKGQAELVAHFLHHFGEKITVDEKLKHPDEDNLSLRSQTNAWEREVSDKVNVVVREVGNNIELRYKFEESGEVNDEGFKAENVGFGLTYALPIIVAILAAKAGSILIIENPEAHLHPSAQSKIAELMARAAMNNVQIFVETHSDHIINGTLVAIHNKIVEHDRVKIFVVDKEEGSPIEVKEINVLENGQILNPPKDFFDQIKKDRRAILI
jgi:predicted ATPase